MRSGREWSDRGFRRGVSNDRRGRFRRGGRRWRGNRLPALEIGRRRRKFDGLWRRLQQVTAGQFGILAVGVGEPEAQFMEGPSGRVPGIPIIEQGFGLLEGEVEALNDVKSDAIECIDVGGAGSPFEVFAGEE